jgi:hypothetical protein
MDSSKQEQCPRVRVMVIWAMAMGLCAACRDAKPQPSPSPPLLGKHSSAMVNGFAASCPTRIEWSPIGNEITCRLAVKPPSAWYSVKFDNEDRVTEFVLGLHRDDEELLGTFDRAIAPIVQDGVRGDLRRAITSAFTAAEFSGARPGAGLEGRIRGHDQLRVAWSRATLPDGRDAKTVVLMYLLPLEERVQR